MVSQPTYTVKVIIISGRSGSGKSSTSYEACHILQGRNIMHVNIEADNLDTMFPRSGSSEVMLTNLRALWVTYWQRACAMWSQSDADGGEDKHLIVLINGTGVVREFERIQSVIEEVINNDGGPYATDGVKLEELLVILEASEDTVTQRLTTREIGSELEAHLTSTLRMNAVLHAWSQQQKKAVTRIVSEGRDVHAVALEVLEAAGAMS